MPWEELAYSALHLAWLIRGTEAALRHSGDSSASSETVMMKLFLSTLYRFCYKCVDTMQLIYSRSSLPQPEMTHEVPSWTLVPWSGRQTGATLSENLTPAPPAFLLILTMARSWLKGPSFLKCGMCGSAEVQGTYW